MRYSSFSVLDGSRGSPVCVDLSLAVEIFPGNSAMLTCYPLSWYFFTFSHPIYIKFYGFESAFGDFGDRLTLGRDFTERFF